MITGSLKSTRVCDGYRCRLRVTRVTMMATVDVTITQQITLCLLDQYYLRYEDKKAEIFGNVCVIMTVKSNKYIMKYSKT